MTSTVNFSISSTRPVPKLGRRDDFIDMDFDLQANSPDEVSFSATPTPKPAGSLGAVVNAITSAVTGETAGWNGTHDGHKGFGPGNKYGSAAYRNGNVVSKQKAHTTAKASARKAIKAHSRKQTPETQRAVARAVQVAAKAHRELMAARQVAQRNKLDTRKAKAEAARAERTTDHMRETLTGRAHLALEDIKRGAKSGEHDAASILGRVERIARGTNKRELFDAAHRAGIEHTATTKGQLVAQIQAHTLKHGGVGAKPAKPIDPASHTDHAPGHVGYLNTDLVHADGSRFQYKLGAAEGSGSVGSLAGVGTYDHNLGGVLSVWKDPANGKVFVVNGHNRLDLAKKLGADKVTVRFLDAKNAKESRSIGALQNIAEGRGSGLDAAKFFRDTGMDAAALARKGIVLRDKIASDGVALAKLDDRTFRRVIDGSITLERGSIIGGSGLSHAQMGALVGEVDSRGKKRGQEITNGTLREMIDQAKAAPVVKREERSLFGTTTEEKSLFASRAKLAANIREKLAGDRKLFGLVSKSKNADELARGNNQIDAARSGEISQEAANALNIYDTHKNLAGPISRALNDAAERIEAGEPHKKVLTDVYKRIHAGVREIIG